MNIKSYFELTKPRITFLILLTTVLGYYLGGKGIRSVAELFWLLGGVGLVCSGASTLNQYVERDADALMLRTKNRPIPSGAIRPGSALSFGILLVLTGVSILCLKTNLLTAFLALLTAFLYVLVYTPMKRISWLNTTLGAIPGALPPVGGWAAATGTLNFEAWILFLILFVWQHPHFYAIAWMCKDDYRRGGFKMLPVVEPDGSRMFKHVVVATWLLLPISMFPTYFGMSGKIYFLGAWGAGLLMLVATKNFAVTRSLVAAKKLLWASVIYLPILLVLIVIDARI